MGAVGGMEREVVGKPNSWQEMPCTAGLFHQGTYNLETATDPRGWISKFFSSSPIR